MDKSRTWIREVFSGTDKLSFGRAMCFYLSSGSLILDALVIVLWATNIISGLNIWACALPNIPLVGGISLAVFYKMSDTKLQVSIGGKTYGFSTPDGA